MKGRTMVRGKELKIESPPTFSKTKSNFSKKMLRYHFCETLQVIGISTWRHVCMYQYIGIDNIIRNATQNVIYSIRGFITNGFLEVGSIYVTYI